MTNWRPDEPYNDLPNPPDAEVLETGRVLRASIKATGSLARLDQATRSMPNPAVLINTIPILEAQASSEIENIVTTIDEMFQHAADDRNATPQAREALRYRTALRVGYDHIAARGLGKTTAMAVCSTIKGLDMDVRSMSGTRLMNPISREITYSPPEGRELILDKLAEWERFVHQDPGRLDPLVMTAAAHYQFEAIHPFSDGNGRTGRILNVLLLRETGLLDEPVLYLSRYIIATKDEYYRRLLAVTAEADWEGWILYMLAGIDRTSRSALAKTSAIAALQQDFAGRARAASRGGEDAELLSVLFEQPYCRIATVVERCGNSRPTATKWLVDLAEAGLLEEVRAGRDRLFVNREFLAVLNRREAV
ncbi:Fic family protein [Gordonia malaquae]|uniref:Fido domain-containing protein n=1 Tax=Gordonia malaquae NBRC 108250 TaxID=1223542 RepID=M3VHA6_GORML|nr:Fic/DOC family N-terminal domain-containing protein [Gordonia malaquae]GAC81744.1 hypothetical protein GM1_043_00170 [Gordonia malaquae NBRC 108250]SEB72188.1 Fic family protein [Gordonia malaquae]